MVDETLKCPHKDCPDYKYCADIETMRKWQEENTEKGQKFWEEVIGN